MTHLVTYLFMNNLRSKIVIKNVNDINFVKWQLLIAH